MIEARDSPRADSRLFRSRVYEAIQAAPAPATSKEIAGYVNYVEDTQYSSTGVRNVLDDLVTEGVLMRRAETREECERRTSEYDSTGRTQRRINQLYWPTERCPDGAVPRRAQGRLWEEVEPWDEKDPSNMRYPKGPRKSKELPTAKRPLRELDKLTPTEEHHEPQVQPKTGAMQIVDTLIEKIVTERTAALVKDNTRLRNENADLRKEVARLTQLMERTRPMLTQVLPAESDR